MKNVDRVAMAVGALLAILAVLRALPGLDFFPFVALEAELGWLLAPAWAVLGYAAWRRSRPIAAAGGLGAFAHGALIVSILSGMELGPGTIPAEGRLRVVQANVYAYNARMDELAGELRDIDADVVVIEELTPEWVVALDRAGVLDAFPHRVVVPRDDCFGIAVLSRRTMIEHDLVDLEGVPAIRAVLDVDGRRVTVYGAHTLPPVDAEYTAVWRAQMLALAGWIRTSDGPAMLVGDLNVSPFGRGYGALLAGATLRGAHETVGRGLATTWPNDTRRIPPMRLDHVLVSRDVAVISVREGEGAGSDHRPVIADLAILGG